ncbi:MAG: hypothetical protein U9Q15_02795 [Patescibacteria group bacterium]|nr:hypothetical protein [Patescibacteria group bacterium]
MGIKKKYFGGQMTEDSLEQGISCVDIICHCNDRKSNRTIILDNDQIGLLVEGSVVFGSTDFTQDRRSEDISLIFDGEKDVIMRSGTRIFVLLRRDIEELDPGDIQDPFISHLYDEIVARVM